VKALLKDIWSLVRGNAEAARVVPPRGISAWLITLTATAMTFLAVIALAFSFTASRVADAWAAELASSLTIRVAAPLEQMKMQTDATLNVLNTTPGITSARIIENEEQAALLEPWLGTGIDMERFSLPTLIAVEESEDGPDRKGLALRLQAEAPGAKLDDHGRWRAPMIAAAERVRNIGGFVLFLVLVALIAVVLLAVQAAVVSNAANISTLRLIGARDTFIVRAFVRRITLRALLGALIGAVVGLGVLMVQGQEEAFSAALGFAGREWIAAVLLVPIVGVITFAATRISAFMALRKLN